MENYYVIEFLARERQREIEKYALAKQRYNRETANKSRPFKRWLQSKLTYRKSEYCSCC